MITFQCYVPVLAHIQLFSISVYFFGVILHLPTLQCIAIPAFHYL